MKERILLCEHLLNEGQCRTVKEEQEGRIVRHDLCTNKQKYSCCYTCSSQASCEIGCDYLIESKNIANFQASADEGIRGLQKELERLSALGVGNEMEKEMHTEPIKVFQKEIDRLGAAKQGCLVSTKYFELVRKKISRTGEERKILSAVEAKVILYPEYGPGESLLSFSRFFLGVIPRYFMTKAFKNWTKSGLFEALRDDSQVEEGEIKDIVDKQVKLTELTLTNRNFLFLYEKGFMSKHQKLIVFPLEHAKIVEAHKKDFVKIGYDVFQEGKDDPQHFDLLIFVKNADQWAETIRDLI